MRSARAFVRRAEAPRGKRRWAVLVAMLVAIVAWQMSFAAKSAKIDDTYKLTASSGIHNERSFVYFFFYTGLFPVTSTLSVDCAAHWICADRDPSAAPAKLSEADARAFMAARGDTLVNDIRWTWYAGDRGKIFLFMLDAWLKGAPFAPSVVPMHRFAFVLSLCALAAALWWMRRPLLGGLAVLFVGSDPFQIYEVHVHDNVFGWSITAAVLVLAIHAPLLGRRRLPRGVVWALPVVTAVLVATIRTFRSEPTPILASAALAYLFVRGMPLTRRLGLVAVLAGTLLVAQSSYNHYFAKKHEDARAAVTAAGGNPFPGPVRFYHHFWHPMWCGLGDFDREHGYTWDDGAALAYAKPILEQKFGQRVPIASFATDLPPDEYWDGERRYYKKLPFDIPNYNEVIRDKVLGDITAHPLWYARILALRVKRVLVEATPVRVSTHLGWLTIPGLSGLSGLLFVPLLGLVLAARARVFAGLLLFTLPSCATALVVYSDRGIAYYGIFHLFAAAVLGILAVAALREAVARRRRRARSTSA